MCSFLLQVPLLSSLLIYCRRTGWDFLCFGVNLGDRWYLDSTDVTASMLSLWSLSCQLSTFIFKWQNCNFQGHHREWAGVQEEGDLDLCLFSNVENCFQSQSRRLLEPSSHQLLSSGHCTERSSLDSPDPSLSPVALLVWSFQKQTYGSLFSYKKGDWGSQKGSELHSLGKQGEESWE